ncbi:ADP-glyceromanno-heptose 6-epimerase [Mucilaginibacter sp. HC2]|uniref:ADP-glyceromanno-heptose 6-epimerase n=1 Tax=Mucilaginibacter inviolabilis TaxID=2714892 RepID=UPI0014087D48|nr:ADP-glyceromanno-heptose 6-epimerase [Mucilaginibacter inviolabilis]NHA04450.1 ADP-glyceromanno-heptose 6-epimerase [Mucilaginibacter inviolabilis]
MSIQKNDAIIITGAAGFIGSCMARHLNYSGFNNLIIVDDFSVPGKEYNWQSIHYTHCIERDKLFDWLKETQIKISFFIHLGARTDTTEFDYTIHQELNLEYSKDVWNYCVKAQVPLIYASSAATYGSGELGYDDRNDIVEDLKPLNPYGISKNEFDKWALKQEQSPVFWAGLKFFNVYGPGEYHKGRMASVIFHSYNQIKDQGSVKLFRSHKKEFKDGQQLRDFIYVKDILFVIMWMMENKLSAGLYNLGTGKAQSFLDLVNSIYTALNKTPDINFIDMPEDIRDKYQYFTEANMNKLLGEGYKNKFFSLEEGVKDYVLNYLVDRKTL